MSVSETERNELYVAVRDLLGEHHAGTLMSLLPPVGWGDVATRIEVDRLEASLHREMDVLGDRIVGRLTFRLAAFNVGFGGVLVAALHAT